MICTRAAAAQLALPGSAHTRRYGSVWAQTEKDSGWVRGRIEDDRSIRVETDRLEAIIPKKDPRQWMTGIEKGSFLDKATGFREVGDGLMVVDWLHGAWQRRGLGRKVVAPDGNGVGR